MEKELISGHLEIFPSFPQKFIDYEMLALKPELKFTPKPELPDYPFPSYVILSYLYIFKREFRKMVEEIFKGSKVIISDNSINFLVKLVNEKNLSYECLFEAFKEVHKTLEGTNITSENIIIEISYEEDPEIPSLQLLFLTLKIKERSLDELQKLWDVIINKFYNKLPLDVYENIGIEVEPWDEFE